MAYDFPASPSVGTLFAPAGGPTWQWNGTAWTNLSPSGLVPEAPTDGQNYVRRNGVWVLAPGTAEAKNRIVNGAMQISQENGSGVVAVNGSHPADQWKSAFVGPVISAARIQTYVTPNGSINTLNCNATTPKPSLAAGDFWAVQQAIEGVRVADFGWGTAAAKQAVLRIGVSLATAGTYAVSIVNGALDRSWIGTFTIAAGEVNIWQTRTFVIPGDTTGTWVKDNSAGLYVRIVLACGTTAQGVPGWQGGNLMGVAGMANAAAVSNWGTVLGDVGLYLDPQNTGIAPPWQMPDEAQELAACQRYWQQITGLFCGNVTSAIAYFYKTPFLVSPRISVPALTGVHSGAGNFPATIGTLVCNGPAAQETRTANATANGGYFHSIIAANARM